MNQRAQVYPQTVRGGLARKLICKRCRKTAYVSMECAGRAAKVIHRHGGPEMRPYEDERCGWIHLSRQRRDP